MGCITSRPWPPEPPKRWIVRYEKKIVHRDGKVVSEIVPVNDYVFDWPSLRCSGSSRPGRDETSTLQDKAIRDMEDR